MKILDDFKIRRLTYSRWLRQKFWSRKFNQKHLLRNIVAKIAFNFLIFFIEFLLLVHYIFFLIIIIFRGNGADWVKRGLHQGNEHLRHISRFIFQTLKKGWSEITLSDWWINIEITLDAIAPGYDHKSELKWEESSLLPKAKSDEKNWKWWRHKLITYDWLTNWSKTIVYIIVLHNLCCIFYLRHLWSLDEIQLFWQHFWFLFSSNNSIVSRDPRTAWSADRSVRVGAKNTILVRCGPTFQKISVLVRCGP